MEAFGISVLARVGGRGCGAVAGSVAGGAASALGLGPAGLADGPAAGGGTAVAAGGARSPPRSFFARARPTSVPGRSGPWRGRFPGPAGDGRSPRTGGGGRSSAARASRAAGRASRPKTGSRRDRPRSPRCPPGGPWGRPGAAFAGPGVRDGRGAARASAAGAGPGRRPEPVAALASSGEQADETNDFTWNSPRLAICRLCPGAAFARMNPRASRWCWSAAAVAARAPPGRLAAANGECGWWSAAAGPATERSLQPGATAACPPRIRSAGSRLTLLTVVAGGPTGGATELPTVILSASGLPVLSTGAVAVGGTGKLWPGTIIAEYKIAPPFSLIWSHTGWVAVTVTPCCGAGAGAWGAGRGRWGRRFGRGCVDVRRLVERALVEPGHHQHEEHNRGDRSEHQPLGHGPRRVGGLEHFGGCGRRTAAAHFGPQLVGNLGPVEPDHGRIAAGEADGVGRRRKLVPVAGFEAFEMALRDSRLGRDILEASSSFPRARRAAARRPKELPFRPVPRPSIRLQHRVEHPV